MSKQSSSNQRMRFPVACLAVAFAMSMILSYVTPAHAAEICEFMLTNCPETYNGDTITVPPKVVAFSSDVYACKSSVLFSDVADSSEAPSIVFVIDHSGSMTGLGTGSNDRWGSRYTVTRALLDTIYASQPNARIGLAVFTNYLFFDPNSSEYYSQYFERMPNTYDGQSRQSYFPLMTLDSTYNGKKGIDILKDVLATDTLTGTKSGSPWEYVDLTYQPASDFGANRYTNINIGFLAAKEAMAAASSPPQRQYVIFLSDGEPAGDDHANLDPYAFVAGTGVPTTFTVYFTSDNTAPQSLQDMTDNIQANGYSSSNPNSDLWTIETSFDDLLDLFSEQILSEILVPANPARMTVNGSRSSSTFIDSTFVFSSNFALDSTITQIQLATTYRYIDTDHKQRDSISTSTFYVNRVAGASVPATISLHCVTVADTDTTVTQPPPPVDSIPVTATLLDTDGDGYLDRIDLTWTDTATIKSTMPTVSELIEKLQITTHSGSKVNLTASQIQADLSNNRIRIMLTENTSSTLETGWTAAIVDLSDIAMAENGSPFYVSRIEDGAGPVVQYARYYKDPTTGADSIVVVFSEPVNWGSSSTTPSDAFTYYRYSEELVAALGTLTASDLTQGDEEAVINMANDFEVIGSIDSIQIESITSRITDKSGNAAPLDGRKTPVVYKGEKAVVNVVNNPFIPGVSVLPSTVQSYYGNVLSNSSGGNNTGTLIGLSTGRPLKPQSDGSYGSAAVYDAVGNVVIDKLKVHQAKGTTDYGVYWNGLNHNDRECGAGTYLVRIVTTDIDGDKLVEILKVGIKRQP